MQALFTQIVERQLHSRAATFRAMDYKKEAGRRLKEAREDAGLTLAELSARLKGVLSQSRISNYEQGLRMLGVKEALAIGPVLAVEPCYLLCADTGDGEMTTQEKQLLRNFRALPEKDRNDYSRRIEVMALAYREPVPDERLSEQVRKGAGRSAKTTR